MKEKMVKAYLIREIWTKEEWYDHYFKTYAEAVERRKEHRASELRLWKKHYGDTESWKTRTNMLDKYSRIKQVVVPARIFEPISIKLNIKF